MKTVLGIHDGHNASVCVIRGGEVAYMVQEERIRYEKNFWGFPSQSVRRALEVLSIEPAELDLVAFSTKASVPRERTREDSLNSFRRMLTAGGMLRMGAVRLMSGKGLYAKLRRGLEVRRQLLEECGIADRPIRSYGHHDCHASSAYFAMREDPSTPYLVLTLDGAGEKNCATVSVGKDNTLERIASTSVPHSMGSLYAHITFLLGFMPYEHEYKLMGMAPYCSPQYAEETARMFHDLVGLRADGLGFEKRCWLPTQMQMRHLQKQMVLKRFDSIAAGIQKFTEDVVVDWARACVKHTGLNRVLCGGGVFMNVKANKKILELPEVGHVGVIPSCGDESLSFGAASLGYADLADAGDIAPWGSIYFGDEVTDEDVHAELSAAGFPHEKVGNLEEKTAELLAAGHPVARCRGRMEFGARALGNRSILADPSKQDCVRVINQMVKKRDFWMPFAPVMLEERADDYIVNPKGVGSPHMMLSFDTRDNFADLIAAVHNADLTARAQILRREHNDDLYACIKHFERLTGRSVVLNTSFNLHGYPVVRRAKEAIHVFANSGLKYMALGDYLVWKSGAESTK